MNLAPIKEIRADLNRMYSMFRFDVKALPITYCYEVICYKGAQRQSHLIIEAETPLHVFWDRIKAWMIPIIRSL